MTIPENVPTIVVVSPWRSVWTAFYAPSQAKLVFGEGICSGACESEKWCEVALIRRSQSTQVFVSGFSRMFPDPCRSRNEIRCLPQRPAPSPRLASPSRSSPELHVFIENGVFGLRTEGSECIRCAVAMPESHLFHLPRFLEVGNQEVE